MRSVSAEAIVAVPRSEAWDRMQDLTLPKHYVPGVTDVQITTDKKIGVGASRKVFQKSRPPLDETVTAWEVGHGFTVRLHNGDLAPSPFREAEFIYRLDDVAGNRTRVTMTLKYSLPFGAFGRLLDALLMRHFAASSVRAVSRGLKQVYEAPC